MVLMLWMVSFDIRLNRVGPRLPPFRTPHRIGTSSVIPVLVLTWVTLFVLSCFIVLVLWSILLLFSNLRISPSRILSNVCKVDKAKVKRFAVFYSTSHFLSGMEIIGKGKPATLLPVFTLVMPGTK